MSIRANPTAIGLFMIGGLILTVVGVATLASTAWFGRQSTFISYFDESVNGLEIGAPVKFQGVPIGQVTNLLIQIESRDKTFQVPVEYSIDLTRLTSQTGSFVDLEDSDVLRQQITDGLRAQLQMESLVTGQLYIELSYNPDAAIATLETRPTAHPEIPTTQSLLAAFGTQAGSVVGEVMGILIRVNEMLEAVNMEELNRSVVASAAAVERLADSPEVLAAIQGIPEVTTQTGRAMEEIRRLTERLGESVDPLQVQVAGTNAEMVLTLQTIREAIEETRSLLTPDSGIGYRMDGTMASLESAADALRALAISLERNPDMLLRGRKPEAN
jgi:paraquat-inducible protein B